MTELQFKLFQIVALPTIGSPVFCFMNWIETGHARVSEFEAGGIVGVVIIKLIEALHIYAADNFGRNADKK